MGGSCQPSGGITPTKGRVGSSDSTSTPNSRVDIYNEYGQLVQQAWYDFLGQRYWTRDWRHGGGRHTFPHDHKWENGKRDDENLTPSPDYC